MAGFFSFHTKGEAMIPFPKGTKVHTDAARAWIGREPVTAQDYNDLSAALAAEELEIRRQLAAIAAEKLEVGRKARREICRSQIECAQEHGIEP
jgi:hypothetical protein